MLRLVLLRILESYFRHRWLNLVPVLLMAILGGVYLYFKEPTYLSGGSLYVKQESFLASLTSVRDSDASWWITPAEATQGEITDLLQTESFVKSVVRKTNLAPKLEMDAETIYETYVEARAAIWIEPIGDNQVFIGATHVEPAVAFQMVEATIENYIQWKINADLVESEAAQVFFGDLISTYQTELDAVHDELQVYLMAHPEPVRGERPDLEQLEIDRLQSELDLAEKRVDRAEEKDENARLAASQAESDARQTYILIDAPVLPEAPNTSLKDKAISFIVFGVIGAILSVGGVAINALLDRTFRFPVDVQHALNLPVLTAVPNLSAEMKAAAAARPAKREISTLEREPAGFNPNLIYGTRELNALNRPIDAQESVTSIS